MDDLGVVDLVGPGGWEHGFIAVRPPATNRPGAKLGRAASHGSRTHTARMSASIAKRSGASSRVGARLTMSEAANRASQKLSGRRASDFQHLAAARLHAASARQPGISDTAKAHHIKYAAMHRGIAGRTPGHGTASERKAVTDSAGRKVLPSKEPGLTVRTMPSFGPQPEKLLPGEANARAAAKANLARTNTFAVGPHAAHAARQKTPVLKSLHANTAPGGKYPDAKMHAAAKAELAKRNALASTPSASSAKVPAALRRGETRAPASGKAQGPNVGELGKAAAGSHRLPKGSEALTKEGRAKAFQHGHALPPPSGGGPHGYPVTDAKSWDNARKAVGRAGSPARREALKQLLRRTAAQYGKTAALKASWAASNVQAALEFAMSVQTFPITGPLDLLISRDPEDGSAVVRHRRGGTEIGRIKHGDDGQWRMSREGKDGEAHTRQRGALLELIGAHNHTAPSPYRRQPAPAAEPVAQVAEQTDLMRAYGIPAINANLSNTDLAGSTPVHGAADGPRITTGLGGKGQTIYKKLRGRGFPHARAHNFARRAERKANG